MKSAQLNTKSTSVFNCLRDRHAMTPPKQDLQVALANIDKRITTAIHARLSIIHANDASLTKQTKTLQSRTHEARKQEDNWDHLVRAGRNGMKVLPRNMGLFA